MKRSCGFNGKIEAAPRVIWMRRSASLSTCPKSFVTSDSQTLLEEFYAWKLFGQMSYLNLPARTVDAFFVLEKEFILERRDA